MTPKSTEAQIAAIEAKHENLQHEVARASVLGSKTFDVVNKMNLELAETRVERLFG